MQQPSAQGIASLYMGNPGALQQRVQKEQQAKPGLPPDLQKLMALNIVTNEQDAAKRQAALSALNGMTQQGQQPPTVAQSIQQQAQQKVQAQMMQQQRQQQGLQALAQQQQGGPAPENTPQPERQPQGIDQLPAEFGMAAGGIVAFADGDEVPYETPYDRMNRENRAAAAARDTPESRRDSEGILKALKAVFVDAPVAGVKHLVSAPGYGFNRDEAPVARDQKAADAVAAANRTALNKADRDSYASTAGVPAPAPAPAAAPTPAPRPAARPAASLATAAGQAAPAAAPAAAPSGVDAAYQDYIKKGLSADRDKTREDEMARHNRLIGKPDTSQYDRLIAELEGRKKQFDAPKEGAAAFGEYMQQIANAGPSRNWFEAGAKGAAGMSALNKERQAQQFEITKQAIDIAQKRIDADRAYNKELYASGEAGAKRIDEIAKETAKEYGLDSRNEKALANQLATANIHAGATLESARIHAGATLGAAKLAAESRGNSAESAADKQKLNELKALQKQYADQLKTTFNRMDKASLQAKLTAVESEIAKMAGLDTMGAAPGAGRPGGTNQQGWSIKPLQ